MSDHWEFALAHARGEYILIVGDDDGLLFGALREIDELLLQLQPQALRWDAVHYGWPSALVPGAANRLMVPLTREIQFLEARDVIPKVANNVIRFALLPSPYTGVVRRDVLDALRSRAGRVFGGSNPDIYSGFAIAHQVRRYPSVTCPFSIGGSSEQSIGAAGVYLGGDHPITKEFRTMNANAALVRHVKAPDIDSLPAYVADMFFRAQETFFPDERAISINRKRLAKECLQALASAGAEGWDAGVRAIRASLLDAPQLLAWFDKESQDRREVPARANVTRFGFDGRRLVLDASLFNVSNVYEAAKLVAGLLGEMDVKDLLMREPPHLTPIQRLRAAARILIRGR